MKNILDNPGLKSQEEKTKQYLLELNRFTNRISWHLRKEGLEDVVRVVECEGSNIVEGLKPIRQFLGRQDKAKALQKQKITKALSPNIP
jgi:hypothetical protein